MRVLIIDQDRVGLDFALRCAAADHDVKWFRYQKKPSRDGEGFKGIAIVDDWRPHMAWAREGLILATVNNKYIPELDRYREHGFKIFAPTVASAKLEISRAAGMEAMQAAGIEVPPYHTFDSLESAAKFARKTDRAFVFKPMGDEEDKALSYVSCDPADLVGWLERRIQRGATLKGQCMLQEKIDMLAEVGVSGWVGPDGFLPEKWQVCFEHKKLMDGECGPNTGEQGTVTQYVETDKLADEMLKPMEAIVRTLGHRGDFAIGAGIDSKGRAWPMEFTARCGFPTLYIQIASHKGDPAQWMRDLLDGKDTLRVDRRVAIGVVMAQPPYPYDDSPCPEVEGNPITGLEDQWDHVHPVSVMMGRGPKMDGGKIVTGAIPMTTGAYVLIATGLGSTVEKARERVYGTVGAVKFANAMYRTDIGEKVIDKLPALHRHGYALQMAP